MQVDWTLNIKEWLFHMKQMKTEVHKIWSFSHITNRGNSTHLVSLVLNNSILLVAKIMCILCVSVCTTDYSIIFTYGYPAS